MKAYVILLMILVFCFQDVLAQRSTTRERKEAKEEMIHDLVKGGQFQFIARTAIPLAGNQIDLTSTYSLTLKGDTVEAYLPYFGRAYSAPYASDEGGIKFVEEIIKKKVIFNERKSMYLINFDVKSLRDHYKISMSVGLSGYADLRVTPTNRQAISYYGIVDGLPAEVK